jgi:hypothetical protein
MPTTLPSTSPYAALTASQVITRVAGLLEQYRREDADRAARRAALLGER